MKSSALILNVFVSLVAFVQYYRAGHFRWSLFWPFDIASIPLSYIGATLPITDSLYKKLLAVVIGGFIGAYQGGFRFNLQTLRYILASVLLNAVAKLYLT